MESVVLQVSNPTGVIPEILWRRMETQDNGFLKEIDGVRKEKERLTAAKLQKDKIMKWEGAGMREPFHRECFYVTGTHFLFKKTMPGPNIVDQQEMPLDSKNIIEI